jgi:hypothetical protein
VVTLLDDDAALRAYRRPASPSGKAANLSPHRARHPAGPRAPLADRTPDGRRKHCKAVVSYAPKRPKWHENGPQEASEGHFRW